MAKTQKSQLNKALAYLIAAFPDCPEFSDMNYEVYYDVLVEYEYEQILDGFRRFVKESGATFFPSAPQIVRWVDPKTSVDEIFDAAMQGQQDHIAKKSKLIEDFLAAKQKGGEWFVRTKAHEQSPFRDVWQWMDGDTMDKHHHWSARYSAAHLLNQHHGLEQAARMHLVNSVVADYAKHLGGAE